jgi:polysaccharide chain length determinant protein (PEP-CTERM system associated)
MQDVLTLLLGYARGIWRYRWIILVVAWPLALAGWLFVARMPDVYEASAKVHVDTDSLLRPLMRGLAVETNVNQRINLMTRTLLTRPNLERVAQMSDMHLDADSDKEMEPIIDDLQDHIKLSGDQRENIYMITYQNDDPKLAYAVVQSLLTFFVESALGDTRGEGSQAEQFLDEQIREHEERLQAAEQRRADFRRENVGLFPGDRGDYYQRLQEVQSLLEETQIKLREAEDRRDEISRQLSGEEPVFGLVEDSVGDQSADASTLEALTMDETSSLDPRITELETRLDELLLSYTERHPDVAILRRNIENLKQEREEELDRKRAELAEKRAQLARLRGGQSVWSGDLNANVVYQQMRIALSNAQVEVSALKVRVEEYKRQIRELQALVDTIPQIEAELTRLNRDYDITRENYQRLLETREKAEMTQTLERRGENVQFRVVEPTRVPSSPSGPNRPLFYTGILGAALGAGLGLAFVASQLRPVFDSRRQLRELTGFPVLGTVSLRVDAGERSRERLELAMFFVMSSLLLAGYGVMLAGGERIGDLL